MERQYDRYTVSGLKNIARERGLRRYSRLRRNELITLLINTGPSILDRDLGTTSDPVLIPTIARPSRQRTPSSTTTSVDDLLRSLENVENVPRSISPEVEALKKRIKDIYSKADQIDVEEGVSSLKGYAKQHKIKGIPVATPQEFLELVQPTIVKIIKSIRGTKIKMNLQCIMKRGEGKDEQRVEANFSSGKKTHSGYETGYEINLEGTNAVDLYYTMMERILENFVSFVTNGSGWYFVSVVHLQLHSVVYEPLRAGGWIPLPDWIANKKVCTNMKNNDVKCFLWCILRALNPKEKNKERVDDNLKSKENSLNMKGINYPVSLHDIDKFERLNKNISVNVYGYNNKKKIKPIRTIKSLKENHVNLLYIKDGEKSHYVLIKNFKGLMREQVSGGHDVEYCMICNCHFGSKKLLDNHMKRCKNYDGVNLRMPDPKNKNDKLIIEFENHCRKIMVPFIVVADFECILEVIKNQEKNDNTIKTQKHVPVSYSYIICSFDRNFFKSKPRKFIGKDAEKHFIDSLTKDAKQLFDEYYKTSVEVILTKEENEKHKNEKKCWICGGEFKDKNNKKVVDHCHFTGKYRGAAHNECNLKAKIPNFIPVFFHNLAGYDAHIFIKYLGKINGRIDCLPNTEEKYISFSKYIMVGKKKFIKLRFLDSFKFLPSSLDNLAKNLEDKDFKNLFDQNYTEDQVKLLRRKGVFPYEWLDSFDKLEETQLPPIEAFYSSLNNEHIELKDYEHALKVWNTFNMKTFKEYLELYNEVDVLLLADVIENFRLSALEEFGLDPAWYYTLPGYGYDAMLKESGIILKLYLDPDKLLFTENEKRGGVSMCSKRYSKANNKYMGELYDPNKPSKYLVYIDKNSLYPWAMSKPLPVGDFEWMTEEELDNWENYPCFLEVDLEYPKELHDKHSDMPLAPERIKVGKVEKLIPNLNDKEKYSLHYEALKTYIRLGLKIKEIHSGIKFKESTDIKKYIDKCVDLRTKAKKDKNSFLEKLWKLMMNAVFGKTVENIRNRVNIELVNSENCERFKKLTMKHNYHDHTIFSLDLVAVHMKKTELKYDKPIYLGVSILDISKTTMVLDYYQYFVKRCGDKVRMCYTDTDSFILEIETEDLYEDLKEVADTMFDFSEYPPNHPLYSEKNRNVLGMFKDELKGDLMTEFVSTG